MPGATSDAVRDRMSQQVRSGTGPEMLLRRELHRRGLRYRVDYRFDLDGLRRRRADIAFTRRRLAVFVDGCFWHSCPEHATFPKANREWWAAKLAGNVARDRDTDQRLAEAGWAVVRIWEHEDVSAAADRVVAVVEDRDRP
ncbi:MAG: very short patch repair endonuclease [Pseudonocardia sp.]|uniref:very short patch repair endonuclease n=1 Tax=Pseudonocardia sp. TaxID=60912 RepID=UPI001ACADAAD|nr:very short patch repair endonuclease [Pseudonocardia sp.]MBN9096707.1 very short patch repair endonuclease [Pseudonocardia sp.]